MKHCKCPVGPHGVTEAGGEAEPRRVRVEATGAWEHRAAQHRSKCPSLWSAKRKCAVSCGVLQGLSWLLIFLPALSLKECKTGG